MAPASGDNVAGLLWDAAEAGDPLVQERDRVATYGDVRGRAAALAAALSITPGERVAILIERGSDAIAALFAVYAAGGVAVVINDRLRVRQIEYALNHSGCAALFTTADMLSRLSRAPDSPAAVISVESVSGSADFSPVMRAPADVAQIIYTSGSTGLPKGVVFTHGALRTGVRMVSAYLGQRRSDRVASLLPLSSVYGLNQVLTAAATGAALVVERSPLPVQVVASLRAMQVTVLAAVPPLWMQLLGVQDFQAPIPSLRLMQNAGGHLPPDAVRRLRAAQPQARLFLQYGMTETFRSTFLPPEDVDRLPGSMGRALPGVDILVLREDDSACETGETGELVHRGGALSAGYWNDEESTARVYRPLPGSSERVVRSGDLVKRDAQGFLHFVARRDRMIKTMGFRVGPDEVLDVLHASGEITEGVVDAEADAERGQRIVAWVVLKTGGELKRLERFCRAELPPHMVPSRIEPRASLPRLASGKYDLPALRA